VRIDTALAEYNTNHLTTLATGAERFLQLDRILHSHMQIGMHDISNADLSRALNRWSGATKNWYRAALTHFWKWGRSLGYADLHPTLLPGKESSRDEVLSINQLRSLYSVADRQGLDWLTYGKLLILTGQRHGDLANFCMSRLVGIDMHLEQRWSQDFGPVVKMDRMTKEMIQNDEEKEPFCGFQS